MIGDIILAIIKWWKQNIACIHDYKYFGPIDYRYEKCTKCDKLKNTSKSIFGVYLFFACVWVLIIFYFSYLKHLF